MTETPMPTKWVYAYADLHMRNGDVIPYHLSGTGYNPDKDPTDFDDYYSDLITPIFTGYYMRDDTREIEKYPDVITTAVEQRGGRPKLTEDTDVRSIRVIRCADVCYATLRYELVDDPTTAAQHNHRSPSPVTPLRSVDPAGSTTPDGDDPSTSSADYPR